MYIVVCSQPGTHVCTCVQTEATAAQLIEKLKSWGQLVTGAADGGSAAPSGHFRVAALMPRALNIQNVPPTVLIRESQMTQSSLVRHRFVYLVQPASLAASTWSV